MTTSAQASLSTIDAFISSVATKVASDGGKPLSEAGSIGGETSHPVGKVDDRLQEAKEGERSKENSSDVKDNVGPPSVDSAGENKSAAAKNPIDLIAGLAKKAGGEVNPLGTAEEDQLQVGTHKAPTGEDPANETKKAKGGKDDPGSSHPARTDNSELDGHKYAYDANTSLAKMASDLKEVGELLCAEIEVASGDGTQKTAAVARPQGQAPGKPAAPQTKQASIDPKLAQAVGWELAGLLTGTLDKNAADAMVRNELKHIIKEAFADAVNVAEFLNGRKLAQRKKQANAGAGDPLSAGGGPTGAGPGPGEGAPDEGADAMGGGDDMGGMGGMGGGDMGGGDMGGGMGGGQIGPEEIAAICQQLGTDPGQLLQALMEMGGGGAGGEMPPGGGGELPGAGAAPPPPGGAGAAAPGGAGGPGMEVAASDKGGKGKGGTKVAIDKAQVHNYIVEVLKRSQR